MTSFGRAAIEGFRWASLCYLLLGALSYLVFILLDLPHFKEVGHLQYGCYNTDAMVPYTECRGLEANSIVKLFINWWRYLAYSALSFLQVPLGPIVFLVVWSPGGYLLWYLFKGRRLTAPLTAGVHLR